MKALKNGHKWQLTSLLMLIFAFAIMIPLSKSSPLYAVNDGVDPNTIFTTGRGLLHGLMPYKDLFDQKGPLLYLMHSLAALISSTSFIGVYVLESISLFATMLGIKKILEFYIPAWPATLLSLITPTLIGMDLFFRGGDTAEEFATPFIVGLLYLIFKHRNASGTELAFTRRELIVQAVFAACVFWIKYTLIGPWLVFYAYLVIQYFIKGHYRKIFDTVLSGFSGFLIPTLPILLFYWAMGALKDLFHVYFYINMHYYSFSPNSTLIQKIASVLQSWFLLPTRSVAGAVLTTLIVASFIQLLIGNQFIKNFQIKLLLFLTLIGHLILIFWGGGTLYYYWEGIAAYLCLAVIAFGVPAYRYLLKHSSILAIGVTLLIAVGCPFLANSNFKYSKLFPTNSTIVYGVYGSDAVGTSKRPEPYELRFAKIINKQPNATLLNYGTLDLGVYLTADKDSVTKYFSINNLPYQPMVKAQYKLLHDKAVTFVVTRIKYGTDISDYVSPGDRQLNKNYHVVASQSATFERIPFTYLLMEKN